VYSSADVHTSSILDLRDSAHACLSVSAPTTLVGITGTGSVTLDLRVTHAGSSDAIADFTSTVSLVGGQHILATPTLLTSVPRGVYDVSLLASSVGVGFTGAVSVDESALNIQTVRTSLPLR